MTDSIPNSENADDSPQDSPTLPSDAPASPSDLDSPTEDFDLALNEGEILEEAIESEQELSQPEPELVFSGSESFAIRRIQRKEPSFLKKVVPPILGGLAAFPIATAIMWYGLGKDIGSTAPFVAKYVPWIVPAKLRGTTFRSDGTFGGSIAKNRQTSRARNSSFSEEELPKTESPKTPDTIPLENSIHDSKVDADRVLPKSERPDITEKKDVAAPSIRSTLLQIAEIQKDWNSTPKERDKQLEKLTAFYSACLQLSSLTGDLRGNAIRAWQDELDQFGKSVLDSNVFSKAIELCSQGGIQSIPAPVLGDNVILIESLSIDKDVAGDQTFPSKLTLDNQPLALIVPEPLIKRLQNSPEPRKRILLGRIVDTETSSVILIHCCLE